MSGDDTLAAEIAAHRPAGDRDVAFCTEDGEDWPCLVARMARLGEQHLSVAQVAMTAAEEARRERDAARNLGAYTAKRYVALLERLVVMGRERAALVEALGQAIEAVDWLLDDWPADQDPGPNIRTDCRRWRALVPAEGGDS